MKKLNTIFSPRKLVVLFLIIIGIFTVPKLDAPAMSQTDAIVTMLCMDLDEQDVVMSATVLTPGQDNVANYQVFKGKGKTFGTAVDSLSITMGKEMGFAQCEVVAMGEKLCESGVMPALDYLTRTKKVGRNSYLIAFKGDAEEFSQAMADLSKEKSLNLENIMNFDSRYIVSQDSNIESFYTGYFSDISMGLMPKVSLETEQQDSAIKIEGQDPSSSGGGGGGSSGGSGGGTSGGSGGGQQNQGKFFLNDGSVTVFKKGKKFMDLSTEQVQKVNFFVNNAQQGTIVLKDVDDPLYDNSTVLVDIVRKKNNISVSFEGDTPVYKSSMDLVVFVEEVDETTPTQKMLRRNNEFLTKHLIELIKENVISQMNEIVDYCKSNQMDLFQAYQHFYKLENKKFKSYLNRVGKENFLNGVKFEYEIKVSNEY